MLAPPETLTRSLTAAVAGLDFIAAAWLFGSLARGEAGPESDLDLAVLLRHEGDATGEELRALARVAARSSARRHRDASRCSSSAARARSCTTA